MSKKSIDTLQKELIKEFDARINAFITFIKNSETHSKDQKGAILDSIIMGSYVSNKSIYRVFIGDSTVEDQTCALKFKNKMYRKMFKEVIGTSPSFIATVSKIILTGVPKLTIQTLETDEDFSTALECPKLKFNFEKCYYDIASSELFMDDSIRQKMITINPFCDLQSLTHDDIYQVIKILPKGWYCDTGTFKYLLDAVYRRPTGENQRGQVEFTTRIAETRTTEERLRNVIRTTPPPITGFTATGEINLVNF